MMKIKIVAIGRSNRCWNQNARDDFVKHAKIYYCGTCKRLVKGFDHHCFLLDMCVGAGNRKHFLLLLWYGGVASALAAYNMATARHSLAMMTPHHGAVSIHSDASHTCGGPESTYCLAALVCFVATALLAHGLLIFFAFHLGLCALGIRTVTLLRTRRCKGESDDQQPYSLDIVHNLQLVFGRGDGWHVLTWLVPLYVPYERCTHPE